MPRFRTISQTIFLFLPLVLALLSRPGFAALIPRYDLESLCYLSTDVVEATLDRSKTNPAAASGTATVTASLIGHYHPGDKVVVNDLDLYMPSRPGQRCILFVTDRQFAFGSGAPKTPTLQVVDLLFIDKYNRVQRYFQWSNPGGLLAEGYPPPGSTEFVRNAYPVDEKCPALAAERHAIAAKWIEANSLRPLLTREPRREDIPALQAVAQQRRQPRRIGPLGMNGLRDVVSEVAQERLAELHVKAD